MRKAIVGFVIPALACGTYLALTGMFENVTAIWGILREDLRSLCIVGCDCVAEEYKKNSLLRLHDVAFNPSALGHLNPSSYCDVGRLFYGVFKLWSKLQRKN